MHCNLLQDFLWRRPEIPTLTALILHFFLSSTVSNRDSFIPAQSLDFSGIKHPGRGFGHGGRVLCDGQKVLLGQVHAGRGGLGPHRHESGQKHHRAGPLDGSPVYIYVWAHRRLPPFAAPEHLRSQQRWHDLPFWQDHRRCNQRAPMLGLFLRVAGGNR